MGRVVNQDYNFIISGEMQGDIYQNNIEMDDTEFYLIKAYLHFFNTLFHVITTYDVSEISVDFTEFSWMNKDHPFLTIRDGKELWSILNPSKLVEESPVDGRWRPNEALSTVVYKPVMRKLSIAIKVVRLAFSSS